MGDFLLLFLILFPILASVWVIPLRRRDRRYRNWLIQIVPAVELAAALLLLQNFPEGHATPASVVRRTMPHLPMVA